MDNQSIRVVLETERHRIVGDLTLPTEGYRSRISDYLNQSDLDFVALTNVQVIEHLESGATETTEREFMAVGARHILLAYPDEASGPRRVAGWLCGPSPPLGVQMAPRLPRRHADRAVEADRLAVEHRVAGDRGDQVGELVRQAEAAREGDRLAERLAGGLGEGGEQRRVEEARGRSP